MLPNTLPKKYTFPDSSLGKESACKAGDPSLVPGLGRYPGEGIGYPTQYSWSSLVAQLVKNLPAMWETWVWSLGWEDPLEKRKVTHSSILAWRIPWTIQSVGSQSQTWLNNFHFQFSFHIGKYLKVLPLTIDAKASDIMKDRY